MAIANRIRINEERLLSDNWYILKTTSFDFQRSDGEWQTLQRETYDRGNGATLLLYNRQQRTVILTRQFRYPAFVNGYAELLVETPAGLLDNVAPEQRIRLEVEEETGFRIQQLEKVFEAFMSPGSVTEKLYFFVAEYQAEDRVSEGGGIHSEGEDIGVFELGIKEALAQIADGRICDGKTIMLLQYAALHLFAD